MSSFSATNMRRHPVTGPIVNNFFRGILGILTLGAGITGILCFTTGNPLQVPGGHATQFFLALALLQSPYLAMFVLAFLYVGRGGIWRGFVLLLGSSGVAGYGLYKLFYYWYLATPPVANKAITAFVVQQWLVVALTIGTAYLPGVLISSGLSRWVSSGDKDKPPQP